MRTALRWLIKGGFVALVLGGYLLSFTAITDVAINRGGLSRGYAVVLALMIDTAITICSAYAWQEALDGRRAFGAIMGALGAALISTSLNLVHAGPDPIARLIAVLPVVFIVSGLELIMSDLRRSSRPADVPATAPDLVPPASQRPAPRLVAFTPNPVPTSSAATTNGGGVTTLTRKPQTEADLDALEAMADAGVRPDRLSEEGVSEALSHRLGEPVLRSRVSRAKRSDPARYDTILQRLRRRPE